MLPSKPCHRANSQQRNTWPILVAGAVALALLGQRALSKESVRSGLILLIPAVVLLLVAHRRCDDGLAPPARGGRSPREPLVQSRRWQVLFLAASLVLALLAHHGFAGNNLTGGLWFWLGSVFYFVAAVADRPRHGRAERSRLLLVALLAVTALGAFFRFYLLDAIPAEMTSDHAEKLRDVHDVLHGWRPIFFPRNTGREGLQFYLTSAIIRFTALAEGHHALKVGTAFFGAITVPLTYFLGRELYGKLAGFYAAALIAISHWHVAISRVGLRFPFTAAFTAPALAFLFRALRENRRNDWLAAGLILGIGLHTYTAMRAVPLLFAILVLVKVVADVLVVVRSEHAGEASSLSISFWRNVVLCSTLALLGFLPLLRYMTEAPHLFWYRTASRAQGALSPSALWATFWSNVKNALLMFNYRGDVVPANTIPGSPQLDTVTGALFLLGAAYLLWRGIACRDRRAVYLLASFGALLLPSILSLAYPEENPSAVRAGGAIPVVMLMAALPLALMTVGANERRDGRARRLILLLPAGLLLLAVALNADWYFNRYRQQELAASWNATEMGIVARAFAEDGGSLSDVYHVAFPHWVDTRNIGINAGQVTWENAVLDLEDIAYHALDPAPKLYLVHPQDDEAVRRLQQQYPAGHLDRYDSPRPGKDFLVFRVGGSP
jgi:hypothetical protein